MNDQGSEITESDERVTLPPILNHLAQPTLVVHEKTNNSVTLSVNTHEMNAMCKVEQYHIRHGDQENHIDPNTLEERRLSVNVINNDVKIEARIKYEGHDWTSWVSSDTPMKEHQKNYPNVLLLSIIIVSVVVVIIL